MRAPWYLFNDGDAPVVVEDIQTYLADSNAERRVSVCLYERPPVSL